MLKRLRELSELERRKRLNGDRSRELQMLLAHVGLRQALSREAAKKEKVMRKLRREMEKHGYYHGDAK